MNSYYAIGAAVAREKLGMVLPSALVGTGLGAAGGALAAGEDNRLTGALAGGALGGGLGAAGGMGLKALMEGKGGLPAAAKAAVPEAAEAAGAAAKAAPAAPPPPSTGALELLQGAGASKGPAVSPELKQKLEALRPGAERPDMFDQAMRAANPGPTPRPPDFLYNGQGIPAAAA